jgi:splicing factor U2AF 35 kDa subunit
LFYEEVFEELANYGQIEEMVVCDNIGKNILKNRNTMKKMIKYRHLGDHMIGNLYVKYASEDDAEKAVFQLRGRYYAGAWRQFCFF